MRNTRGYEDKRNSDKIRTGGHLASCRLHTSFQISVRHASDLQAYCKHIAGMWSLRYILMGNAKSVVFWRKSHHDKLR